jgi:hypothetical protein
MDFKVDGFVSPALLEIVKNAGLHRVVGAMEGLDEMTLKEAVAILGAKAYAQRVENTKIAEGLAALAALTGEK